MLTKSRDSSFEKKGDDQVKIKYKIQGSKLIVDLEFLLYRYDLYGKSFYLNLVEKNLY